LSCYNFDMRERILMFFGRNATDKGDNQKTFYCATSRNLCFCTTWQNGKHENCIFTRCISALLEFNQLLLDFFNLFDSRLIITLLYDSLNLVTNAFSLGLSWGVVQEKGSRGRCRSLTVLHAQNTSALSSRFPLSQGNVEVLDRWGGEVKHLLISHIISNTSAENYRNRIVYVKSVANQTWDVFWVTVYIVVHFIPPMCIVVTTLLLISINLYTCYI